MKSLKELYKIGRGPSSSHTIGPQIVAEYTLQTYGTGKYAVELFGSLALTGKGHGTDRVLKQVLGADTEIIFNTAEKNLPHPNTLKIYKFSSFDAKGKSDLVITAQSVGGGSVVINGKNYPETPEVYPQKNFEEIKKFISARNMSLVEYVMFYEPDAFLYFKKCGRR